MKIKNSVLAMLILSLLIKYVPGFFPLALLRSYAIQFAILALLIGLILLIKQKFKLLFLNIISILVFISIFGNSINYQNETPLLLSDISIAHFNVLKANKNYKKTIDAAIKSNADFLSFQEVDYKWLNELANSLLETYPYYKAITLNESSYGIAVFSKIKLENVNEIYLGELPNISGDICAKNDTLHFITSHTASPTYYSRFKQRNEHIKDIAEYVNSIHKPVIAIGDYNCVPWDKAMIDFRNETHLADSRKSLCTTFPSNIKIAQIPIDYIFHSDELKCTSFGSIKSTSSDHYGILGKYIFNNKNQISQNTNN